MTNKERGDFMIRGTTAVFKFTLPHKLKHITEAKVVFWQEGYAGTMGSSLPIVKGFTSQDFVDNESKDLLVVLTGTETRAFTDKLKARVQMKALSMEYTDENGRLIKGTSLGTRPQLFTVYPMDGEIIDGAIDENTQTNDGYIILSGGNIIATEIVK